MKLKCKINEVEYDIVQGASFSDEYNETLDSGTIVISHVHVIRNLKPYNDVYIWDNTDNLKFNGYNYDESTDENKIYFLNNNLEEISYKYNQKTLKFENEKGEEFFFKHLLVNNFNKQMINLKDFTQDEKGVGKYKPIYTYTIQLFSETKKLETIKLPNRSITEPLNIEKKITISEYLRRFVELYSTLKKEKVINAKGNSWKYKTKYKISEKLKETFNNLYSPDFTLNNPDLKSIISKLIIIKDMIPYVKNDVIYGMDITKRKSNFEEGDFKYINYIQGAMTSSDYCDNLRKTYNDALSQNSLSKRIEYLGFRNSDEPLMTLDNMRLETKFPIYKINKVTMCYYKRANRTTSVGIRNYPCMFLCKQDITPFIKLNTERQALSQDWEKFSGILNSITGIKKSEINIEEITQYKMATIGYDIGSKYITGWGTKYTYPIKNTFWDVSKTYLENILTIMEYRQPAGKYGYEFFSAKRTVEESEDGQITKDYSPKYPVIDNGNISVFELLISPTELFADNEENPSGTPAKMKGIFFEVEYQAFYNGTVIHSKDKSFDDITIIDNPSESLTLLEQDGIYTKEKVNRFGNESFTINARYDNINQLKELGSVYNDYDNKDIIIYHREYQIWDNYIQTVYHGMKDYVLKNFYTSVFARHRTWNLMPYNESVKRSENKKMFILFSKDNCYYEKENNQILFYKKDFDYLKHIISFFMDNINESSITYVGEEEFSDYNFGYLTHVEGNNKRHYASDVNSFISGNSICFNISMDDNISAGTYIEKVSPEIDSNFMNDFTQKMGDIFGTSGIVSNVMKYMFSGNVENDYTGSEQKRYLIYDDKETGEIKEMEFAIGKLEKKSIAVEDITDFSQEKIDGYYDILFNLPQISNIENIVTNQIGNTFKLYKDNKEVIDITYQIEPVTDNSDIYFSPWLMKLSDMVGGNLKILKSFGKNKEYTAEKGVKYNVDISASYEPEYPGSSNSDYSFPVLSLILSNSLYGKLLEGHKAIFVGQQEKDSFEFTSNFRRTPSISKSYDDISYFKIIFKEMKYDTARDKLIVSCETFTQTTTYTTGAVGFEGMMPIFAPIITKGDIRGGSQTFEFNLMPNESNKKPGEAAISYSGISDCKIFSNIAKAVYKNGRADAETPSDNKILDHSSGYKYNWQSINLQNGFVFSNDLRNTQINSNTVFFPDEEEDSENKSYEINMKIVASPNSIDNGLIYTEYSRSELLNVLEIENSTKSVFTFERKSNNMPYLRINLENEYLKIPNLESVKSIQQWYFDENSKSWKFVFGVNLSEEDKKVRETIEKNYVSDEGEEETKTFEIRYVDIYLSWLSNRDYRIYDEKNNVIGNNLNYAENKTMLYGVEQIFSPVNSFAPQGTNYRMINILNHQNYIELYGKNKDGEYIKLENNNFTDSTEFKIVKSNNNFKFKYNIKEIDGEEYKVLENERYFSVGEEIKTISINILKLISLQVEDLLNQVIITVKGIIWENGSQILEGDTYQISLKDKSIEIVSAFLKLINNTFSTPTISSSSNMKEALKSQDGITGLATTDMLFEVKYENIANIKINDAKEYIRIYNSNNEDITNTPYVNKDEVVKIKYIAPEGEVQPNGIYINYVSNSGNILTSYKPQVDVKNEVMSNEGLTQTLLSGTYTIQVHYNDVTIIEIEDKEEKVRVYNPVTEKLIPGWVTKGSIINIQYPIENNEDNIEITILEYNKNEFNNLFPVPYTQQITTKGGFNFEVTKDYCKIEVDYNPSSGSIEI